MTGRERLLASIRHEKPDYIPNNPRAGFWLLDYYGGWGCNEQLRSAREFDWDPIVHLDLDVPNPMYTQFASYREIPDVKVDLSLSTDDRGLVACKRTIHTPAGKLNDEMVYAPSFGIYGIVPDPEKKEYMVKDRSDLEKVKYLLPDPWKTSQRDFSRCREDVGDIGLVSMRAHKGADHLLVDSVGLDHAMVLYYEDYDLLKDLLDTYATYYRRCIERALEYRPDVLFDSWYNCTLSAGWSPSIWRELFFPNILENRRLAEDAGVFYHYYDDGKIMAILPDLKELRPDILSTLCPPPLGDIDLPKVKEELGKQTCLMGYVDLQTILRGTPEQVEAEVKYAIETAGEDGGFILSTSDSIRNTSPIENVRAYFSSARKYGKISN